MSYGIRTAYRLVIEGLGLEAVTDPEMERLAPDNYRRRVRGLLREGLRIEEEADPAYATIEASGMTVSIVDRQVDEVWCQYLSGQPSRRTWLTADLAATSARWIIAYWHHPPYTFGSHDSDSPTDSGGSSLSACSAASALASSVSATS